MNLIAPGAPPQNLIAHSPSTGTITAAWSPPTPLELQYGILSGYEISFGIAESNITQISFSSDLSITRTGLLSNITYSITVAAVNGAGTSDNTTTLNINLRELLHHNYMIVVRDNCLLCVHLCDVCAVHLTYVQVCLCTSHIMFRLET